MVNLPDAPHVASREGSRLWNTPQPPIGGRAGTFRRQPSVPSNPWVPLLDGTTRSRDREKEQTISKKEFRLCCKYKPAAERAVEAQEEIQSRYYTKPQYTAVGDYHRNGCYPIDPNSYDLRQRDPGVDLHPRPMCFGVKTMRERIEREIAAAPRLHAVPEPPPPHGLYRRSDTSKWLGKEFARFQKAGGLFGLPMALNVLPEPFKDRPPAFRPREIAKEIPVKSKNHSERRRGFLPVVK
eukprot:Sspe_Gene.81922::Locus_53217_Transcript_1_1_Confidence_1.000_Length_773::g.81922::m.81922